VLKRIEKYIVWSVLIITWLIFILIILLDAFRFLQNDWQNKGKVDSFSRIDEIYVEEVEEDEEKIESLPTTKIASRRKIGKVNIFSSNSCFEYSPSKISTSSSFNGFILLNVSDNTYPYLSSAKI